MEKVQITFALIILIALLGIINAQQRKRYSDSLFQERVLDLLLEARRRGLFVDSNVQRKKRPYHQLHGFNSDLKREKMFGHNDDPLDANE